MTGKTYTSSHGGEQYMSGESLEILNLRRTLEIQNRILEEILEEMKKQNKKGEK